MASKHTPGPWLGRRTPQDGAINAVEIFTAEIFQHTAKFSGPTYVGLIYDKRNGNLISAAPDLLEACTFALEIIEAHLPELHDGSMANKLRAAISKAETE